MVVVADITQLSFNSCAWSIWSDKNRFCTLTTFTSGDSVLLTKMCKCERYWLLQLFSSSLMRESEKQADESELPAISTHHLQKKLCDRMFGIQALSIFFTAPNASYCWTFDCSLTWWTLWSEIATGMWPELHGNSNSVWCDISIRDRSLVISKHILYAHQLSQFKFSSFPFFKHQQYPAPASLQVEVLFYVCGTVLDCVKPTSRSRFK